MDIKSCKMKIYATKELWDWSVLSFGFLIFVSMDYLCICELYVFTFCKQQFAYNLAHS